MSSLRATPAGVALTINEHEHEPSKIGSTVAYVAAVGSRRCACSRLHPAARRAANPARAAQREHTGTQLCDGHCIEQLGRHAGLRNPCTPGAAIVRGGYRSALSAGKRALCASVGSARMSQRVRRAFNVARSMPTLCSPCRWMASAKHDGSRAVRSARSRRHHISSDLLRWCVRGFESAPHVEDVGNAGASNRTCTVLKNECRRILCVCDQHQRPTCHDQ